MPNGSPIEEIKIGTPKKSMIKYIVKNIEFNFFTKLIIDYLISLPPHSTTVKPCLLNGDNV